jgi:hypothetical protein
MRSHAVALLARAAVLAVAAFASTSIFASTARAQGAQGMLAAPPIPAAPDCTRWTGNAANGNSPALSRARLCVRGNEVTGLFQWSTPSIGWAEFEITGAVANGARVYGTHTVRLVQNHPAAGSSFCTDGTQQFIVLSDDTIDGVYDSRACNHNGRVTLHRIEDGAPSCRLGADTDDQRVGLCFAVLACIAGWRRRQRAARR